MIIPDRVVQRVLSNLTVEPSGCHVSGYSVGSHGYAQIGWHNNDGIRVATLCHRVLWITTNGDIPEGWTIDHLCRNRRCVNLDHLRILPNFENARRTSGRDWPLGQCINGHDNSHLYTEPQGRIRCRLCKREFYERNKDHANELRRARKALKLLA